MKKKKLWSSIARIAVALLFVGSWTVLGITLALTQVNVNLKGGITFTATDIYATISGGMAGNTSTQNADKLKTIEINAYSTNGDGGEDDVESAINSWDGLDLVFGTDDIIITIDIKNESTEQLINVNFTDKLAKQVAEGSETDIENLQVTRQVSNSRANNDDSGEYTYTNVDGGLTSLQIQTETTRQIKITLHIVNRNNSLKVENGKWGGLQIGLEATRAQLVEHWNERGLTFGSYSDTDNSCALTSTTVTDLNNIPSAVICNEKVYKVTAIGSGTSAISTDIISVTIPDSVTEISKKAFLNCTTLTSVTIPNTVTSIGDSAFLGCTGLTSITIPDSVTEIVANAFSGDTNLSTVIIGSDSELTLIGDSAFKSAAITSIYIPEKVTQIGKNAFNGCSLLQSVTGFKRGVWKVSRTGSEDEEVTISDSTLGTDIATKLTDNANGYRAYTWIWQRVED